jgi:hypothetical protein
MIRLFFSYAHQDEALRDELEKHLTGLRHQGIIEMWHDRRIGAGEEWAAKIDSNLQTADVILLLVSADFIASPYCYDNELKEAMRRHEAGEARVIPVILRPCEWHDLPFGKLQAATKDGRPVTKFPSLDDGFLEVVQAIKAAAKAIDSRRTGGPQSASSLVTPAAAAATPGGGDFPRSSDLRVKKNFTDHDRDVFRTEAFEYVAAYFENSLKELSARNPQLQTAHRRRDANSFEAIIFQDGKQASKCGVWLGSGSFNEGIAYSHAGLGNGNSYNESLSVEDDGHSLGLKPLGMALHYSGDRKTLLTQEGAAEFFWTMFIQPLR